MDLNRLNLRKARVYLDKGSFSEITDGDDPYIGYALKDTYEEFRADIQNSAFPLHGTENHAKFAVYWRYRGEWSHVSYSRIYLSGWYRDDRGVTLSTSFLDSDEDDDDDIPSEVLREVEKDFHARGIELVADSSLKFCEAYCHSEQSWMSQISTNEEMFADDRDRPEIVILQVVSLDPVCNTCKKMFKNIQTERNLRKKFLKNLFPSLKRQDDPPLFIFFHNVSAHYEIRGIDFQGTKTSRFIEDLNFRGVVLRQDNLE